MTTSANPKPSSQSKKASTTTEKKHTQQIPSPKLPDLKLSGSESEDADYDLRAAPSKPKPKASSLEELFGLLYSEGYLNTLTSDARLLGQFTSFLKKYEPSLSPLVVQYLETQKVTKAVNYANAIASTISSKTSETTSPAAELSSTFKTSSRKVFQTLLETALPAWITYSLTKTATVCLTSEITNTSTSLTQDLVRGLSEVFCLTDPTQHDNPIIYASSEFYKLTGYDKDKVIGYNCRFLQGSKTDGKTVGRLKDAIEKGEEICEALMNYTRGGKPFVNLLLLAPLKDGKGKVRYYLGAQVDCSKLVEGMRGVAGFERFLVAREMQSREGEIDGKGKALRALRELSGAFDLEECAVVRSGSRRASISSARDEGSIRSVNKTRRRLNDEDEHSESDEGSEAEKEKQEWKLARGLKSGRLPGLYKKYILVRPYPSLRMVFVSQAARKLGKLQQRRFLAHIAAPPSTLSGLKESFESGNPVTAKIALMSQAGESREGTTTGRWGKRGEDPAEKGTVCWISATPLLDAEENAGVWMVVIVDEKSASLDRGRIPDVLKREDGKLETRLEEKDAPQEQLNNSSDRKSKVAGDVNCVLTSEIEAATLDIPSQLSEVPRGQRSESTIEQDQAVTNGVPTESTNGSPMSSLARSPSRPPLIEQAHDLNSDQENPTAPPRTESEMASDITPAQVRPRGVQAQSARDIGLRAMDYLSSRSSMQKLQARDVTQDGEEGDVDLSAASPYSVD